MLVVASDLALGPLLLLPPLAGLMVVSALTGAAVVFVVARTSDQPALAGCRRGIHAALFEIRLFADDPFATVRALGEILARTWRYVRLSLVPLAWMALPIALVMAQLHAVYGYTGLTPGTSALVTAHLRDTGATGPQATPLTLEAPPGIQISTPAVHLPGSKEVLWRIVPVAPGAYTLAIRDGAHLVSKSILVSAAPARRSPRRGSRLLDHLLYPSESPLPAGGSIAAVVVAYPERDIGLPGARARWIVLYLLLSTVCAWGLARRHRIVI